MNEHAELIRRLRYYTSDEHGRNRMVALVIASLSKEMPDLSVLLKMHDDIKKAADALEAK